MFKKAAKQKIRFSTTRGIQNVESLWDMPLTSKSGFSLDDVYKELKRELKNTEEESLLTPKTAENKDLTLKLEIVTEIINDRLEERNAASEAKKNKEKRDKILAAMADLEDSEIKGKSREELNAMLAELSS